ncbi:DUF6973 domain-containing protein [Sphingomonas sp. SRS2]|uniref:DUF6973 domain-containing protein n=1 Tax=Sphingomonas sp. SRS2 TaxID=133190 RepID=UPI00128DFE26|nr:hypothetical protein [Sphingomonas sp. SRS2]
MMEEEARKKAEASSICPPVGQQDMGSKTWGENLAGRPGWQVLSAVGSGLAAQHAAAQRFPDSKQHNDEADAYRHALWNIKMTRAMSPQSAADFANSYEVSGQDPPAEHRMDLYNNAVGRAMATDPRFSKMSAQELAYLAYRNNCFQVRSK